MVFSEDKKLLNGNVFTRSYDSIVPRDQMLAICIHGNSPEECCSEILAGDKKHFAHANLKRLMSDGFNCNDNINQGKIDQMAKKRLIFASCFCLTFMTAEVVGGILANSLAIASDAAHLLTDFAGFIISLMSLYISARPATKRMNFGWYRAEVLGALISVLLIWVVTAVLVYMAVLRLQTGKFEVDGAVMLITATIGVCFNVVMGFALQFGCAPKLDEATESIENGIPSKMNETQNINVRAAFIHVIGDLIQSIGVLSAAFIIYFKPEYAIVDPICTFLFSVLVLITTITILKDVLNVLLEGTPSGVDQKEVSELLLKVPGVVRVHNLRIWSLSMDKTALSSHIVIGEDENPYTILKSASKIMRETVGVCELTLQIEENKMNDISLEER